VFDVIDLSLLELIVLNIIKCMMLLEAENAQFVMS
jgi:hypothetical protein